MCTAPEKISTRCSGCLVSTRDVHKYYYPLNVCPEVVRYGPVVTVSGVKAGSTRTDCAIYFVPNSTRRRT